MMTKTSHTTPKNQPYPKKTRILISVSVLGSTGPLKMLVDDGDSVSRVIHNALKLYAREGRHPVIGSDRDQFILYCRDYIGCQAVLGSSESIGPTGVRSFLMGPKNPKPLNNTANAAERGRAASAASLRSWINKSGIKIVQWVK